MRLFFQAGSVTEREILSVVGFTMLSALTWMLLHMLSGVAKIKWDKLLLKAATLKLAPTNAVLKICSCNFSSLLYWKGIILGGEVFFKCFIIMIIIVNKQNSQVKFLHLIWCKNNVQKLDLRVFPLCKNNNSKIH